MKRNPIIRIILFSFIIVVLLSMLLSGLAYDSLLFTNHTVQENSAQATISVETPVQALPSEETLTFAPEEVRELEIEWVSGAIVIQKADVETVTISESDVSDEKYAMVWKLKNGKLSLNFCEETIVVGFGINFGKDFSKDLSIFVPRDWELQSLDIDAASATVEVIDLTITEVEFDGASGTCRFDNCIVDTIDMDTASGDITFTGSLNILDFDGASADICAVLSNTPNRMDIDTASGDLDLTLPQDTGFTVSMDTLSGDFNSDFETITKNGNHYYGDGRCRIQIDAMSGDVTIRKGQ